jgi:hypothetical protein
VSPSWRNRLLVGLAPERVALIEQKHKQPLSLADCRVRVCPSATGSPKTGALAALDALLAERSSAGTAVHVVLSNQFLRYIEVPWTPGVHTEKDRQALATECFRAVHGDAVDGWQISLDKPHFGRNSLAAAVDRALVDGVRATLASRKLQLAVLRPHLSAAFDGWQQHLHTDDGGFVVVEPGCITALFRRGDAWSLVDNRRFRAEVAGEADSILKQVIDIDQIQGGEGVIALLAQNTPGLNALGGRPWRRLTRHEGSWPGDPWHSLAWSAG